MVVLVGKIMSAQGVAVSLGGGVWASPLVIRAGVWARGVLAKSGALKLSQSMTAIVGSKGMR